MANMPKPEVISNTLPGKTSSSVTEERRESPAISRVLAGGLIGSPEEKDIEDALAKVDKEISRMKGVLKKMKLATSRQRNISMDIKDGLCEVEESVEVVESLRGFWGVALQRLIRLQGRATISQGVTQVSPVSRPVEREITAVVANTVAVNSKNPPLNEWTEVRSRKGREVQKDSDLQLSREVQPARAKSKKKTKKNKNKKTTQKRPLSDALLIKPAEGKSYAEVLGEIRGKVKPEDTETEVKCIRQTRTGDILVELGRNTKDKTAFEMAIVKALQEKATVSQLEPKDSVEIRDLDSLSSEEEVVDAIKAQLGEDVGDVKVHLTKPNNRGLKVAVVQLNVRGASELAKGGFIKIGWVRCRVRRRAVVKRCFKCLGFGHIAGVCKGPDRSSLCYKCGGMGHVAKECNGKESCMLCTERNLTQEACQHPPGSGRCVVFREALEQAKRLIAG
uniref:CCHC-type domain-containing protein n=1 Tax=Rhodnius prolixus TaxID=13249 RepID=T1HVK9_RHOPR